MKTTHGIFVRSAAAALCFIMMLCSAACSSAKESGETTELPTQSEQSKQTEYPEKTELMTEFKYSFNYTDWTVPKTDDEPFKDITVRNVIESKPLDSGYVFSSTLEANESVTVALVLYCAAGTVGAESRLSISYDAAAVSESN